MSESNRTPLIHLEVDQEVFIDAVRDGDTVEDATVATEVTSFERAGDAYVLEGAIVFAGYLKRASDADPQVEPDDDILAYGMADDGVVQSIHQRLPFSLRVPMTAQPRGIVNVASRIQSWKLEVIGSGWMRIQSDLQITGLSGQRGYHFTCGAQEQGDLLLEDVVQVEPEADIAVAAHQADGPGGDVSRGTPSNASPSVPDARTDPDAVSDARQGHGWEDVGVSSAPSGARSTKDDLQHFDRAFAGSGDPPRGADGWTQFDVEHQVDAPVHPHTGAVNDTRDEMFVPSRSFSTEGFRPTSGFVPQVNVGTNFGESGEPEPVPPLETEATQFGEDADVRNWSGLPSTLWSFVNFNGPEHSYTLRFVIVEQDETLDDISDRVGCPKSDLMVSNRLTTETARAGQTLLIPAVM